MHTQKRNLISSWTYSNFDNCIKHIKVNIEKVAFRIMKDVNEWHLRDGDIIETKNINESNRDEIQEGEIVEIDTSFAKIFQKNHLRDFCAKE